MVTVACFEIRVSVMFHPMFFHYTFSSVWVAEWKIAACSVGHTFSLSFVYLYFKFISYFGFKSGIWLVIAPVPVHFWRLSCFKSVFCC